MSAKKILVAASASLAGLLFLACAGSARAQTQKVLFCYINSTLVNPGDHAALQCFTNMIALSAITAGNDLRVEYVDAEGQTSDPTLVIDSIEGTLDVNGAGGDNDLLDFMDVAFSPYAHTPGGGGTAPNELNLSTFGGLNSPNIDLLKSSIAGWVGASARNVDFSLQVFVTNTGTHAQAAQGGLHVIVSYNNLE